MYYIYTTNILINIFHLWEIHPSALNNGMRPSMLTGSLMYEKYTSCRWLGKMDSHRNTVPVSICMVFSLCFPGHTKKSRTTWVLKVLCYNYMYLDWIHRTEGFLQNMLTACTSGNYNFPVLWSIVISLRHNAYLLISLHGLMLHVLISCKGQGPMSRWQNQVRGGHTMLDCSAHRRITYTTSSSSTGLYTVQSEPWSSCRAWVDQNSASLNRVQLHERKLNALHGKLKSKAVTV